MQKHLSGMYPSFGNRIIDVIDVYESIRGADPTDPLYITILHTPHVALIDLYISGLGSGSKEFRAYLDNYTSDSATKPNTNNDYIELEKIQIAQNNSDWDNKIISIKSLILKPNRRIIINPLYTGYDYNIAYQISGYYIEV